MSKRKYTYRALFKPDSLSVFQDFHESIQGDGRALGYAQAWHKSAIEKYTIANEYVAAEIGSYLRLPIPPFAITWIDDKDLVFSSLDFNFMRAKLPEIIPEFLWKKKPALVAGIIAFDILIANEDRHSSNLVVDKVRSPRELIVFDHDQSLFSGYGKEGISRLESVRTELGIVKKMSSRSVNHCLMDQIDSDLLFYEWFKRIASIPNWFLDCVCNEAKNKCGITDAETGELLDFLKWRRDNIEFIVRNNKGHFSKIQSWEFDKGLFK